MILAEPRQMHVTVFLRTDTEQGDYLRMSAKTRDISLTRMVQTIINKVVEDQLITAVLDDAGGHQRKKREHRYRKAAL
jgi:hypothetical protein